ncbi:MAG: hypothetical protein K2L97_01530 [Muribaculaceae bacterium]|nr:hypothetical protein [Muribaculaceae bacterium]
METVRKVVYDDEVAEKLPLCRTLLFEADVVNRPTDEALRGELDDLARKLSAKYKVEDINKTGPIAATRAAYKACGKDPNRYRPSQEQLMRRIVRGLGLYNVNALVDAGNELSLLTGCSVGCFDADKVEGDTLTLGVGREGEPYEGIGRGMLNIAGLPVFRDRAGGVGTPTSDNERTKLELTTRRMVVTVHLFDTEIKPDDVISLFTDIFTRHGRATNIRHSLFSPAKQG